MNILVSIVIPTYNRANLIIETLDSVTNQSYQNWECIIVDDGSTDNTQDVVENYVNKDSRFSFYKRPANRPNGGNAARNFGLSVSKGQLINWLDSDDKLMPLHLESHLECHDRYNIMASVSSARVFNDISNQIEHYWSNTIPKKDLITEMMTNKTLWQTGCVVWSKSRLPEMPFNETLASSQEWTFHLETLASGLDYQIINEVTYLARGHSERKGQNPPKKKVFSTIKSRLIIFNTYQAQKLLNQDRELILLQTISTSIKEALEYGYVNVAWFGIKCILKVIRRSKFKLKLLRVVFIAFPCYLIIRKGYRLFQL